MSDTFKLDKFQLNYAGVGQLLKSEMVVGALIANADKVKNRAGSDYDVYRHGRTRSNVSVRTTTDEAYQDNLQNNTLLKALNK